MNKSYLLALLLLPFLAFSQDVPQTELDRLLEFSPDVKQGRLANGLRYYIVRNTKPEHRMELRLAVNAGSTSEDEDQRGLAHFVEHMAFNGTKNFKKNELVNYLESIGTKFGPHLNAYTSFDETVYMMQVPTDSTPIMNKAFQILEDWAHNLSFDSMEVEKERGVVIEEWRLGQGAFERMRTAYWPVLFMGSRYENRLPIGRKDILEKAPPSKLKQFYKDWYRPELMTVVAVGDFDVEEVEKKIIAHFNNLTNPPKPRELTRWDVPFSPGVEIAPAKDKEAPYTLVQIFYKRDKEEYVNEADYRRVLKERLFNGMVSSRLEELTHKSNPPFTYAGASYGEFVRYKNSYTAFAITNDKSIKEAISAMLEVNEGVRKIGFGHEEFKTQIQVLKRSLEKQMFEADKTESSRIINRIVAAALRNQVYMSPQKEMELFTKYINTIKIEDVNEFARTLLDKPNENCMIVIQTPDKEGIKVPDHIGAMNLVKDAMKKEVKPRDDFDYSSLPLLSKPPVPGKISSEKKIDKGDFIEWKLANGATILFKKTAFKNDEVLFRAFSWGGASLYGINDDVNASVGAEIISNSGAGNYDYTTLKKILKGKIVSVTPYISETTEGMTGNASPQDMETMMQLIHLYFTAPRKDTTGFKSYMAEQKSFVENRSLDPENAFDDTVACVMSQYHPRRRPWDMTLLKEINHNRAYTIYKERFSNAADFTFLFVGNIDENMLKSLAEKYIGSIPATGTPEKWADIGIYLPPGKIKKTVFKGIEPKSSVTMKFTGPALYSPKESMYLKALLKLMSIKLRESLREDNSGTYGVSCYGSISRIPQQEFTVTVSFGCGPENVDKLIKAANKVIEQVKTEGCSDADMVKVKETFRREMEVNLKENNWWAGVLSSKYLMNDEIPTQEGLMEFLNSLTAKDFAEACKKYFSDENYACFIWKPAK